MTEAERQQFTDEVVGIVLPAGGADLLLPGSAVVEIVGYRSVSAVEKAPDRLLGNLDWRERSVPAVSVAAASGQSVQTEPGRRSCLVVCYTPSGNQALPYLALLARAAFAFARKP